MRVDRITEANIKRREWEEQEGELIVLFYDRKQEMRSKKQAISSKKNRT